MYGNDCGPSNEPPTRRRISSHGQRGYVHSIDKISKALNLNAAKTSALFREGRIRILTQ